MESDTLIEEHRDLIDKVAWYVVRKFRVPARLYDDVWSDAGLALVLAARRFDGEGNPRPYLHMKMTYIVIDEYRLRYGRHKDSGKRVMETTKRSLNAKSQVTAHEDGDEWIDWLTDPAAELAFERVGDGDEINEFLDGLPTARHREIVIRRLAGESMREIGERLGVTESRISQIVARIGRVELAGDDEEEDEQEEWGREELWDGPLSLDVNWR